MTKYSRSKRKWVPSLLTHLNPFIFFFLPSALGLGRNTTEVSEEALISCGTNFCPSNGDEKEAAVTNVNETSEVEDNFKTTSTQIYTLAGIYLACALTAPIILALFLDPLDT